MMDRRELFNTFDTIECLSKQVEAMLELIMMADSSVCPAAIQTAAEMGLDIHTDLMKHISGLEDLIKEETK